MNIHRAVDSKQKLTADNFNRWLIFFELTIDSMYVGSFADRAKRLAATIAFNMSRTLA